LAGKKEQHQMSLSEIYQHFVADLKATRWQEWTSTGMQIASVWYARKNNILVYPTGIVGVLLAFWVYLFLVHPPLYADAWLNIYYFAMSVWGWYNWVQKKDEQHLAYPIGWCTANALWAGLLIFVAGWGVIFLLLTKLTNSNTPILDALVTASACTAMWWMARRKIENWLAWMVSNVVAIPLNFYKGLMLFTLMYILFLAMAWWGYKDWKKTIQHGNH
jgi:nicotinamide mononucleotide transporter